MPIFLIETNNENEVANKQEILSSNFFVRDVLMIVFLTLLLYCGIFKPFSPIKAEAKIPASSEKL